VAGLLLYPLALVLGILVSAWAWERGPTAGDPPTPRQRHAIYVGALLGMAIGAKLGYLLSEGWLDALRAELPVSTRALLLLQGRSVVSALLGGYAGVELAKKRVGYARATGDSFALLAPLSLSMGRLGCWFSGCCLGVELPRAAYTLDDAHGVARFPAVPLELGFNLLFLLWVVCILRRRARGAGDGLRGQLFHVYLISYGLFRALHERVRDTPRLAFGVSGYQLLALGCVALGVHGFMRRGAEARGDNAHTPTTGR
jgi:phosphatidylglycerol:prolipoprotein diacylglycerol transferase